MFCKILYTLFTFDFSKEKIPLYNTEKKLGFVDVFLEKFTNYFHAKRGSPYKWGEPHLLYCLSIKNAKVNIENRTCNVALFKVTYHNLLGRQFCFHTFRVQYN